MVTLIKEELPGSGGNLKFYSIIHFLLAFLLNIPLVNF